MFTNSEADGGNRRLNRVLYLIALTQWSKGGPGRCYIERRMAQGKSWLEAVRALKRFIARIVWRLWQRHYAQNCPSVPCGGNGVKPPNLGIIDPLLT